MSEDPVQAGAQGVRLRSPERKQVEMRLECVDELVAEKDPVRVIWEVTGKLDLSAFYAPIRAREGVVGRDATDPRLLVALWLYAATRGVGSARELERLCKEHRAFEWLCGGVSVNHHTLSDFRVGHGKALDALLSQLIAALVEQELVSVWRISQDGTRVRACAGAGSFRRRERLEKLLEQAKQHVEQLRRQVEDPALGARRQAARERAARERQQRLEQALARLPELEKKQQELASKVAKKDKAKKLREPRASTTDADVAVMRMSDGGYRPAVNVQLACDPQSRTIVGVEVSNSGVDTGQSESMREQVERRGGQKVKEHLLDGGYLSFEDIERAAQQQVALYVPPKPPRNRAQRDSAYAPRKGDSAAVAAWRQRMGSDQGKEIYKLRGASSEPVNADLKSHRGLRQITVRGVGKIRCAVLWSALAYNLMRHGAALLA